MLPLYVRCCGAGKAGRRTEVIKSTHRLHRVAETRRLRSFVVCVMVALTERIATAARRWPKCSPGVAMSHRDGGGVGVSTAMESQRKGSTTPGIHFSFYGMIIGRC